jgi:uncharacterized protein DUF4240
MTIEQFWEIVNRVRDVSGLNFEKRVSALEVELAKLSPAEIQSFQEHYDTLILRSNHWDLIGAAYLMLVGGITDDRFRYFQDWLISEGEEVYNKALANPDTLADVHIETRDLFLESYNYVALRVFKAKTGEALERSFANELYQIRLIDSVSSPDSQRESKQLYGRVMIRLRGQGHDSDCIAFERSRTRSAL